MLSACLWNGCIDPCATRASALSARERSCRTFGTLYSKQRTVPALFALASPAGGAPTRELLPSVGGVFAAARSRTLAYTELRCALVSRPLLGALHARAAAVVRLNSIASARGIDRRCVRRWGYGIDRRSAGGCAHLGPNLCHLPPWQRQSRRCW